MMIQMQNSAQLAQAKQLADGVNDALKNLTSNNAVLEGTADQAYYKWNRRF